MYATDPSYFMSHMNKSVKFTKPKTFGISHRTYPLNSVLGSITSDPAFRIWSKLIRQSKTEKLFTSDTCEQSSVVVVPDEYMINTTCNGLTPIDYFYNIDDYTAKRIIEQHVFKYAFTPAELRLVDADVYVENGDRVNTEHGKIGDANIIGNAKYVDGTVFIVDMVTFPYTYG